MNDNEFKNTQEYKELCNECYKFFAKGKVKEEDSKYINMSYAQHVLNYAEKTKIQVLFSFLKYLFYYCAAFLYGVYLGLLLLIKKPFIQSSWYFGILKQDVNFFIFYRKNKDLIEKCKEIQKS